jgi:hypothetical protein
MDSLNSTDPAILQIYTGVNGADTGGISFGVEQANGTLTERVRFRKTGQVHIGNATGETTNSRLSITPVTTETKITLWDGASLTDHYGFGVSSNQLNYEAPAAGNHVFYTGNKNAGASTINGTERMRMRGSDGNISIGAVTPTERLTVSGNVSASGSVVAGSFSTSTGVISGAKLTVTGSGTNTATSGILFNSFPMLERVKVVAGTANNTTTLNVLESNVWLFTTNSTGDWNPNIRGNDTTTLNSLLAVGDSVSVTIISKQNSTAHNITGLTIDGAPQTVDEDYDY